MDMPRTLFAGLKAAALGSLIGTSLPSVITIAIGITSLSANPSDAAFFMFFPFLVGLAGALAGLILVGLPITAWLRRNGRETGSAYLTFGLLGGILVTALLGLWLFDGGIVEALFFAVFGAATGGATGHFWWRFARKEDVEGQVDQIADVFG